MESSPAEFLENSFNLCSMYRPLHHLRYVVIEHGRCMQKRAACSALRES